MLWGLIAVFWTLTATHGAADQLAAVSRMEIDSEGSCTAVLVRPTVALTAAHCVHGFTKKRPIEVLRVRLSDFPVDGELFKVSRVVLHPLYDPDHPRLDWRYRFDLAAIELTEPVPADRVTPIAGGATAEVGEKLVLASWRKHPRPRQRKCPVLDGGIPGLVTLGCDVRGGESGSPVLRLTEDGVELVAIISSRARLKDQPVAQASDISLRLTPLLRLLE